MYNILVVDDEAKIRSIVKKYGEFEGHTITEAQDGMEAVELCKTKSFDIIIMDIMMPELDGFSAVREIRKTSNVPIIMLSARGEEYDRINGFEVGIDDYVVKPFSPKELMLRIEAVMRRLKSASIIPEQQPNTVISLLEGKLRLDITARIVYIDDQKVDFSPKEYDLLYFFVTNRNMALTREVLLNRVWGYEFFGDERTLDTHIKVLRKNLGPYAYTIVTLRAVGYRFEAD